MTKEAEILKQLKRINERLTTLFTEAKRVKDFYRLNRYLSEHANYAITRHKAEALRFAGLSTWLNGSLPYSYVVSIMGWMKSWWPFSGR